MASERIVVDQMGYEVGVPHIPRRIISLVPSQTELIHDLGYSDSLVGITKFCIHPKHLLKEKSIIGGTKDFRFDVIDQLKPDLIIGNKEENYEEGINILKKKYPVWMSDIYNLNDSLSMIESLGSILNANEQAQKLVSLINSSFANVNPPKRYKALYFIWNLPRMVAGSHTFINEMLNVAGFDNAAPSARYPELSNDEIKTLNPEVVLLSSEPFPFKEKHINQFRELVPGAIIKIVDGELFSWYGSRLKLAPDYFIQVHQKISQQVGNLSNN